MVVSIESFECCFNHWLLAILAKSLQWLLIYIFRDANHLWTPNGIWALSQQYENRHLKQQG